MEGDTGENEEGNVQGQDFGVTHCSEASEDTLEHCLYIAMQSFLWGKDVSKFAWLASTFSTPTRENQKSFCVSRAWRLDCARKP